jgi:hypothetical protein
MIVRLSEWMLDDPKLAYAAYQAGGFAIAEKEIVQPLVAEEREAIAPLCDKLLTLVRAQQDADSSSKPVKRGHVLSAIVSGFLADRLLRLCARKGWQPPPELLDLIKVLLKGNRLSTHNSNHDEWPVPREYARYLYRRGERSAHKIAKAVGRSHTTVLKWFKEFEAP